MTPLDQALAYAAMARPVFPCRWQEPGRKRPLTPRGLHDASCDPAMIGKWWRLWPEALIGMPPHNTGPLLDDSVADLWPEATP
jgi:Bifunctional DNA primase/polymerase, N-terminal